MGAIEIDLDEMFVRKTIDDIVALALESPWPVKCAAVLVTPEIARCLRARNYKANRKFIKIHSDNFGSLLMSNAWMEGSQIRLACDNGEWVVIDAQHRLQAIIETNTPAWCIVVLDKNPADVAYTIADAVGRARSIADGLHAKGIDAQNQIPKSLVAQFSAALRILHVGFGNLGGLNAAKTKQNIVESVAGEWAPVMGDVAESLTKLPKTISSTRMWTKGPILALVLATWRYQKKLAQPYWEASILDDGLRTTQPEKINHELMATGGGGGYFWQRQNMVKGAYCWNAYYLGKQLRGMPSQTDWPGILGTPYAK